MVGNLGTSGMSPRTRVALWSFWEYASFVINSILFLFIGMEVHVADLFHEWRAVALAIGAVLLGRALAVYGLTGLTNLDLTENQYSLATRARVGRFAWCVVVGSGLKPEPRS